MGCFFLCLGCAQAFTGFLGNRLAAYYSEHKLAYFGMLAIVFTTVFTLLCY